MSDNQGNPLQGSETDLQKAQKAVNGLLNTPEETQTGETQQQNSPEPQNEESSNEEQPQEQEISEETESEEEEVSEQDVSQDEEQIDTQEKQDSTEEALHKVKVAGQEFEVTLDELRNGYSRDADYRRKTEELSNDRKNFHSQSEKQRQDYSQKLKEVNELMSVAQEQLNTEISSSDLEALYDEDPAQAARIEHRLRKKQEKINSAMAKNQSEQKKQFDMFLKDQQTKLVSKMPEFSDPDKASQLKTSMKSTLNAYGFNDTEVAQVYDHRIVMLVNDAMKYRNLQKAKPNIAKKITKPGKVFTSGVKQSKSEISSKARKEKLSRLRKSGSVKDATSIFLDMINKK